MSPPEALPDKEAPDPRLRVGRVAWFDGLVVMALGVASALLAAISRDLPITLACLVAALAGAMELRGSMQLKRGSRHAVVWLIAGQGLLLAVILSYCAWRFTRPNLDFLRAALLEDSRRALREAGLSEDAFLRFLNKVLYACVAVTSLFYQGGMALYYFLKGRGLPQGPS